MFFYSTCTTLILPRRLQTIRRIHIQRLQSNSQPPVDRIHLSHGIRNYSLTERVRNEKISSDFFIDASHELSLFAWNNGRGHKLSRAPYFCVGHRPPLPSPQPSLSSSGNGCAIYFGGSDEAAANDESIEGGSSGGSEHTQLYPTPASSKTTTTKTGAPSVRMSPKLPFFPESEAYKY